MVSTKLVIMGVLIFAFVVGGGVGITSGVLDRVRFQSQKIRTSLNKREDS